MLHDEKFLLLEACFAARECEAMRGFVEGFIGYYESSPMHAHGMPGADVLVNLHRFLRIHVHGPHEPTRLIGAYG